MAVVARRVGACQTLALSPRACSQQSPHPVDAAVLPGARAMLPAVLSQCLRNACYVPSSAFTLPALDRRGRTAVNLRLLIHTHHRSSSPRPSAVGCTASSKAPRRTPPGGELASRLYVCMCVHARVRACVCMCVRACVSVWLALFLDPALHPPADLYPNLDPAVNHSSPIDTWLQTNCASCVCMSPPSTGIMRSCASRCRRWASMFSRPRRNDNNNEAGRMWVQAGVIWMGYGLEACMSAQLELRARDVYGVRQ